MKIERSEQYSQKTAMVLNLYQMNPDHIVFFKHICLSSVEIGLS
jgi:hypothetical protein